ncbi:sensor histidine kinase [Longimicrobium terrae]|uniref:histidine kinase n=1 Tax=Longimicrobium terrae TaxID=1639882 RepID=A0A841GXI0_9BACT|nr:HAMP domain-containing sensor histidine kinase [Longimicrobium terrae]MBB4636064.1 signal transduction histidine kinase [Longimicrobium terrae]MBB6070459.1 signal transduction histidine kinase [Longimicrobium terrae]NNC29450.1 HAMP domain-containing histidine kinase [Longimicrobium terrae]
MMLVMAVQSAIPPDNRLLFVVSVVVVASVVLFTAGVIVTLLRRSDRRRAEEEKLAAMGTATARILHQIKNPLQTIVLHADLLQNDRIVSDAEQRREVADAIIGESQRLVDMLEELSVYASGAQRSMNRQPVALDELVKHVAAHEARDAGDSGLLVDTSRMDRAVVLADAYYLRQAIDNLVRNAREAMAEQEGARLAVSVERDPAGAVVRVADNGPGIAADKLERIFEPFVSTKGKGMGLGLAICREIAEAHAGRLDVDSTVGQGTTFTLRLPLHGDGVTTGALPGLAPEPRGMGTSWN